MISFNMNIVKKDGTIVRCDSSSDSDLIEFDYADFYRNYYLKYLISFGPCIKLFKGDIVRDQGVKFDTTEKLGEDQLFNVAYFDHIKNFCFISDALYNYVRREQSATNISCTDKFTYHYRLFKKKCAIIGTHLDDYIGSGLFIIHITCGISHTINSCGHLDVNSYRKFLRHVILAYRTNYNFSPTQFQLALENFFQAEQTPPPEQAKTVRFFALLTFY
jgi:hypothetical protein